MAGLFLIGNVAGTHLTKTRLPQSVIRNRRLTFPMPGYLNGASRRDLDFLACLVRVSGGCGGSLESDSDSVSLIVSVLQTGSIAGGVLYMSSATCMSRLASAFSAIVQSFFRRRVISLLKHNDSFFTFRIVKLNLFFKLKIEIEDTSAANTEEAGIY